MPKELIRLGMTFVQYMPVTIVDLFLVKLADFIFGDLSNYGIVRPGVGPLQLKSKTGRSSVIDVGTAGLIKKGVVKVKILFQQIQNVVSPARCSRGFRRSLETKFSSNAGRTANSMPSCLRQVTRAVRIYGSRYLNCVSCQVS